MPWRGRAARQRGDLLEPHDTPGAALVSPEDSHGVMDGIALQAGNRRRAELGADVRSE
jgi:hypothetical protein